MVSARVVRITAIGLNGAMSLPLAEVDLFHWPPGLRPADHAGLGEPGS
jgi:nuclear transport factor 2 (NTF2) superfamily protein